MKKRWLIRGLAIMLLALCVVAWVGSYWRGAGVTYTGKDEYELGVLCGKIYVGNVNAISPSSRTQGVHAFVFPGFHIGDEDTHPYLLGFWKNPLGAEIGIPLYLPTLVSALLLWLVWRKTKAKPIGGAFPVEVAAAKAVGGQG